jgi:hypothetical protein
MRKKVQCMVKLAQVHRVELGQPQAFDKPRTVEQVLDQLEERVGPRDRREFEGFLRKMERPEAEENGMNEDVETVLVCAPWGPGGSADQDHHDTVDFAKAGTGRNGQSWRASRKQFEFA